MVESVEFRALIAACEILRNFFQEDYIAWAQNFNNRSRFTAREEAGD